MQDQRYEGGYQKSSGEGADGRKAALEDGAGKADVPDKPAFSVKYIKFRTVDGADGTSGIDQ